MSARPVRRSVLDRKWSAGVLSAALVLSVGAAVALPGGGAAQAASTTTATMSTKKKWLIDPALTSMYDVNTVIGATDVWGRKDASGKALTGQGVGVALIDSGIAPVHGLDQAGKVVNGPDLSFESQAANLRNLDTFGHGTHMAGIIAGRDPEVKAGNEKDPKHFVGVAPDARLVNLRVAAADGTVDVSQIIAAIDWAVTHRKDPGVNIRVINLSFGTDSLQDPRLDPLSYAVEAAWRAGIVVVVSVGNDGPTDTRVGDPAINPYVIAVGASDIAGTLGRNDDTMGTFSTRGDTTRHADLVAPGRSIVSLRDPGAFVDVNYPGGLVADGTGRFFKGSGTSQAAAVVSGAAALLLQQRPTLTPDQVKKLLTGTATPMTGVDAVAQGAGELQIDAAVNAAMPAAVTQSFPRALGTGTLEGARGTAHVADSGSGVELTGEQDIMGKAWNPAAWTVASAAGTSWNGGTWNGNVWAGAGWNGTSWATKTWSGTAWTARTWSGSSWTARTWSDAGWDGAGWSARTWSASTWSARTWSGGSWASRTWQ
jgi:serine protease AprX